MDNYFDGTGTIGFTCDNCGRQLQGCTWVNGMKFCAKCYQETFGNNNMTENLKNMYDAYSKIIAEKDKTIADLEAKLAESESKSYTLESHNNFLNNKCKKLIKENKQLKQQLAEKEKEIEKITKIVAYRDDMDRSTTINGIKFSDEQIITLQNIDYFADKHNHDKISFAVEQLEKVKLYNRQRAYNYMPLTNYIDNQIKQLKEGQ